MRSSVSIRARVLGALFIVVACLLVLRLYLVQVVHGKEYQKDAVSQYVAQGNSEENRGTIFFTTKDKELVAAAVMQSGWRIAVQPNLLGHVGKTFDAINEIMPLDRERFIRSAEKPNDPYEEVAVRLSDEAANAVRAKKLPGVLLVADEWRFYPARELAANVVGFVGFKGDSRTGVYGLERSYENTLAAAAAGLYVNPFAEIFTNLSSLLSFDPTTNKGSIITTIEPHVQRQLEITLDSVMKTYTPEFSGGIIMDPSNGAILAMAGRPTFDPNTYNLEEDVAVFGNRLVEGRYELGSIMKPLTMAIGIDSGAVKPTTTYKDTGCATVSEYKICNFDLKARGTISMQGVLNESLNLGAAHVAEKTGYPLFTTYVRAFGFGEKTKIDLPNEVTGDLTPVGDGNMPEVNYATAAYGQGIAVSPIEMIRALATLANHGEMPQPHVVSGVKYENGITRSVTLPATRIVLKPQTAEAVTAMLIKTFDTALLNGKLKLEHYSIAAKTGTAQIPQPGGGYYPPGTYLHSFFGYFPAHDPRFIVFLFANKPIGQQYASATLAEPFMDITKYLINYYNIPPDR